MTIFTKLNDGFHSLEEAVFGAVDDAQEKLDSTLESTFDEFKEDKNEFFDSFEDKLTSLADKAELLAKNLIPGSNNTAEKLAVNVINTVESHVKSLAHLFDQETDELLDTIEDKLENSTAFIDRFQEKMSNKIKTILQEENIDLLSKDVNNIAKNIMVSVFSGESFLDSKQVHDALDKLESDLVTIISSHKEELIVEAKSIIAAEVVEHMNVTDINMHNDTIEIVGVDNTVTA